MLKQSAGIPGQQRGDRIAVSPCNVPDPSAHDGTLRPWVILFATFAYPWLTVAQGEVVTDVAPPVQKLIPFIQANEILYDNVELGYSYQYQLIGDHSDERLDAIANANVKQITQGDLFWLNYDHRAISVAGNERSESRITGYDGSTTKSWIQNAIGNIHHNRVADPELFHPFRRVNFSPKVRLSEYLTSGLSRMNVPQNILIRESISLKGTEHFLGQNCIVLVSETELSGTQGGMEVIERHKDCLWISPERNYLPLKHERFKIEGGRERRQITTEVTVLEEIDEGVFFPTAITSCEYDADAAEDDRIMTQRIWETKTVDLNPYYPLERFRDVQFGPDAIVYIVKDGDIIAEYGTGANDDVTQPLTKGLRNDRMTQPNQQMDGRDRPADDAESLPDSQGETARRHAATVAERSILPTAFTVVLVIVLVALGLKVCRINRAG